MPQNVHGCLCAGPKTICDICATRRIVPNSVIAEWDWIRHERNPNEKGRSSALILSYGREKWWMPVVTLHSSASG